MAISSAMSDGMKMLPSGAPADHQGRSE